MATAGQRKGIVVQEWKKQAADGEGQGEGEGEGCWLAIAHWNGEQCPPPAAAWGGRGRVYLSSGQDGPLQTVSTAQHFFHTTAASIHH